ncbi:protein FAM173B [Biomphalaria glabrata]|nr:protein FAM173B [Biomphalaria glabrata]
MNTLKNIDIPNQECDFCKELSEMGLRRISLPFIPASSHQINNVMKALRGRTGKLIDIGSGDGRITLAAARNGFQAYGVELNIWLVLWSRWTAWRSGLHKQAKFFRKDLWKTDLSIYQNVVIFGVESMMKPLEDKLDQEMLPGTHIVACRFPLPSWQPVLVCGEGIDSVWFHQSVLNLAATVYNCFQRFEDLWMKFRMAQLNTVKFLLNSPWYV